MVTRRKFSREFKLEAVKLVTQRGVSVAQGAKDLDVHENVLRKWVRELREAPQDAFPGLGRQKVQDAEIARLRKEVAKLKMERDILKKAALDSTRRCNGSLKSTGRRFIVQRFSRPGIQAHGDGIQIGLAVAREVYSLRQVLANQSIGVLIGSTLPRASWITKENIDLG